MWGSQPWRWLRVWAACGALLAAVPGRAQPPVPPTELPTALPPAVPATPPAAPLPAAPVPPPVAPANPGTVPPGADGPFAINSAVLYPPGQEIGWYATAGVGLLKPHLAARLTTPGPLTAANPNPPFLGAAPLDWTGAPEVGVGYRLDKGAGEFFANYRLVAAAGSGPLLGTDPGGPGIVHSRLNLNTVDLDYVLPEFLIPDAWATSRWFRREFRAGFGLRAASGFFDSVAVGPATPELRGSSLFAGVGPHGFWEYRQHLGDRPLWLYTRVSAAGVLGKIRQRFAETDLTPGGPVGGGSNTGWLSNGVGTVGAEAGLSWANPVGLRDTRLTVAYSWERWWDFGRTDDSNAELTIQGIVFRAEFRY